jgi:Uma2 family endonuclease
MFATSRETAIPEAKPAFELIDERLCQKVSPRYDHARLQTTLVALFSDWAKGRGRVGTEWRFSLDEPFGPNSLVPDVAYLSYERLARTERAAAQEPHLAPDVTVEVLSPSDWRSQVDRKTTIYLAAGTRLVLEIDPGVRTVRTRALGLDRVHRAGEIMEHPAMPGFRLDVTALFAVLDE